MEARILSICPAPAGLVAVYKWAPDGTEHREPVAALGMIEEDGMQFAVALVIDPECGTLEPADNASNFDRLEWAEATGCRCSPS